MTRINVVPIGELHNKHLLAEYRELPRVFGAAKKWWDRGGVRSDLPVSYRLGKGHVLFFYDKLSFCFNRQFDLYEECLNRGFKVKYNPREGGFDVAPVELFNDYKPTVRALRINRERIAERLATMKR